MCLPLDRAVPSKKKRPKIRQDAYAGDMGKPVATWTLISPTHMEIAAWKLGTLGYSDVFATSSKWNIKREHYALLREHLGTDGCVVIYQWEGQEF